MSEQSDERLRLALASAGMGCWEWDLQSGSMVWDDQMHAHFGLPPGAFEQQYAAFLLRISPEERAAVSQRMRDTAINGGEYDGEFRAAPVPGTGPRYFRMRFTSQAVNARPPAAAITGLCWEITDRRLALEQLSVREHLLTTLMDFLPDNIYFKDLQSRFIAVSRAMSCRHGEIEPSGMINKSDFDYFSEEHAQAAFEDEQRVIATGFPLLAAVEKETWPDGRVTWVSTTKMPLRDPSGEIIGTFGLSRDVTARKRAEEELAQMADELRSKNQALEADLEMARELQNALLPQRYPRFPHAASQDDSALRFCHYFNASTSVSGDFFDVLDVSNTTAGIFVCDVMGHGVRAALVAAIIRTLIHDLRHFWGQPAELLTRLNRKLREVLKGTETPIFASAFYGVVDIEKGTLNFANAGHPNPLLVHHLPADRLPHPLTGGKHGPALGLFDRPQYTTYLEMLAPQDVMLLFTDGLFEVEGANGRLYDYDSLVNSVSRRGDLQPAALCNEVIAEIKQFSASKEFNDDVCLVAVELDHLHLAGSTT